MKIFAIYSPITPKQSSCIPPKKNIGIIVEAQPATVPPYHMLKIKNHDPKKKEATEIKNPNKTISFRGKVEKFRKRDLKLY